MDRIPIENATICEHCKHLDRGMNDPFREWTCKAKRKHDYIFGIENSGRPVSCKDVNVDGDCEDYELDENATPKKHLRERREDT